MTDRTELIDHARAEAAELFASHIDDKPEDFDFLSWDEECPWEVLEAVECEECGQMIVDGTEHRDGCEKWDKPIEGDGPMMNYRYPIDATFDAENARTIAHLNLCLVDINGETFLALTGGGMDFSWEICEAYARLGFLPPSHFTLPKMAGITLNERTALVLAAVERSNEILAGWAARRAATAAEMLHVLPTA